MIEGEVGGRWTGEKVQEEEKEKLDLVGQWGSNQSEISSGFWVGVEKEKERLPRKTRPKAGYMDLYRGESWSLIVIVFTKLPPRTDIEDIILVSDTKHGNYEVGYHIIVSPLVPLQSQHILIALVASFWRITKSAHWPLPRYYAILTSMGDQCKQCPWTHDGLKLWSCSTVSAKPSSSAVIWIRFTARIGCTPIAFRYGIYRV